MSFLSPVNLKGSQVALSPVVESQLDWITPEIKQVVDGRIVIKNTTSSPVIIRKKSIFADVVAIKEVTEESNHIIRKIITESNDPSRFKRPEILHKKENYIDEISIDPDNQLSSEWRSKFKNLCTQFMDTISPFAGRYNGSYGDIDNSIDFVSTPPPSTKARLPHYSTEKLKIMAKLMDELEDMGVLATPEDAGVTQAFVVPSLLMPKPEKGTWRLVSDFTPLT